MRNFVTCRILIRWDHSLWGRVISFRFLWRPSWYQKWCLDTIVDIKALDFVMIKCLDDGHSSPTAIFLTKFLQVQKFFRKYRYRWEWHLSGNIYDVQSKALIKNPSPHGLWINVICLNILYNAWKMVTHPPQRYFLTKFLQVQKFCH